MGNNDFFAVTRKQVYDHVVETHKRHGVEYGESWQSFKRRNYTPAKLQEVLRKDKQMIERLYKWDHGIVALIISKTEMIKKKVIHLNYSWITKEKK